MRQLKKGTSLSTFSITFSGDEHPLGPAKLFHGETGMPRQSCPLIA